MTAGEITGAAALVVSLILGLLTYYRGRRADTAAVEATAANTRSKETEIALNGLNGLVDRLTAEVTRLTRAHAECEQRNAELALTVDRHEEALAAMRHELDEARAVADAVINANRGKK